MHQTEKITQGQAAALLGVTTRRIRQRSQEESPPPQDEAGQYPCEAFGKWMQNDWRRGMNFNEEGIAYDYDAERARLTHHQANNAALEEQTKHRLLIPAEQVRQTWSDIVAAARAKLLALPARLASSCAGKKSSEVEEEARSIVYEALTELAGGGDGVPTNN